MSLPRKIMEQCRLCPTHRAFILCRAKSQSLQTLLHKVMEQCKLCPAKSRRHSFRGPNNNLKLDFFSFFFLAFLCEIIVISEIYATIGTIHKEKIFCVTVTLNKFKLLKNCKCAILVQIVCHCKVGDLRWKDFS